MRIATGQIEENLAPPNPAKESMRQGGLEGGEAPGHLVARDGAEPRAGREPPPQLQAVAASEIAQASKRCETTSMVVHSSAS